jgi:hypothetical protein
MRKLLLIACALFIGYTSQAQQSSVKGEINDTINKVSLQNTVISLLRAKDSVLVKFTRSNKEGHFELNNVKDGNYVIMITHATYANYYDQLTVKPGEEIKLGRIPLTLQAKLLENVTVRQTIAAMRMKGDTLEYRTDSFKVRQGASVEDLLKVLPGIQVDKDGKITAQGEKIEKVLVDGEEFFSDDPTIATRGLQADALERVQVFDKKSDQATFTGIDDGQKTKTLNLKLKEDRKKGYFGKLDAAAGTDDRWNGQAMINVFKGKRKFSAYGIMSSTGKTGLDWNDQSNYGGGQNMEMMDDGGIMMFGGGGQDFSAYGQGLPKSWTGALHYSNKYNNDKQNINGSYRYSKLNTEGFNNSLSQNVIENNVIYQRDQTTNSSSRFRHSLSGIYDLQIDSFTSVKITLNGYKGENRGLSNFFGEVEQEANGRRSTREGYSTNAGENQNLTSSLLLRKRFRKPGRTVSLNVDQAHNRNNTAGIQYSLNEYFSGTVLDSARLFDQQKLNISESNSVNTRIVYTEPLSKKLFTEVNYGLRISNNNSERSTFNADNTGKYTMFDNIYSNNYKFNFLINTFGLNFKYNTKKVNMGAGMDVAQADFKQTDQLSKVETKRNYTNLFPKANFTYIFNANSRFTFTYNGNTRQPSISQIQPVRDNTNTLVELIGNANLKQEFRQNFNLRYNSYKMLNQRGIYTSFNMSTTSNAISRYDIIEPTGKTTSQYINVNGNYNFFSNIGYNLKVKALDAHVNFGINLNGGRYIQFVNTKRNVTNTLTPGFGFGFNKGKEKKYSANLWANFNYNMSKSSLFPDRETNYYTFSAYPNFNVQLPAKFEINVDAEINLRQKTSVFDQDNNVYLLNGYIGRKILKNDKGIIKITGYDLLNQNKGYNRFISNNSIQERTFQVLQQYFMLNFTWNFAKTPAGMGPMQY